MRAHFIELKRNPNQLSHSEYSLVHEFVKSLKNQNFTQFDTQAVHACSILQERAHQALVNNSSINFNTVFGIWSKNTSFEGRNSCRQTAIRTFENLLKKCAPQPMTT